MTEKKFRWWLLAIPAGLVAAILMAVVALPLRSGIEVAVENSGTKPLKSVTLHVTGASYNLGDIAPGASATARMMNGSMMVWFSGLNKKSDEAGFIVIYPSGTGTGPFLTWNAGGFRGKMADGRADDVAFIGRLLDDCGTVVKVDANDLMWEFFQKHPMK